MRNRALHDALREFALEAAALLSDDQRAGAELEFDVESEGKRRGPALYRYRPLTERFIGERWHRLRELESCERAAAALGAGASAWLRMNGLKGAQAEPALQAMLERLYEDATSFGFPEERFERLYGEVEHTFYRDTVKATVAAPLRGLSIEDDRVELGDGLVLARRALLDLPPDAGGDPDDVLCLLERDATPDEPLALEDAGERFRRLVTALRLFKPGGVALAPLAWRRSGEGRWAPVELVGTGNGRGATWVLEAGEGDDLCAFLAALDGVHVPGAIAWALERFEMGCGRALVSEALSDYLLGLRALLDASSDAGRASLALRLAALCAEEGERRAVRRRLELAITLERFLMGGGRGEELQAWIGTESPTALIGELEAHLRALLRDVICGYLDPDLKTVADDILLEAPEQGQIVARDLRRFRRTEDGGLIEQPLAEDGETTEMEALPPEPPPAPVEAFASGVTPSADWDDEPEDWSAPV